MSKLIDLTGQRFGRLTVLERDLNNKIHPAWICQCDCGNIVSRQRATLRAGRSLSCGCLKNEKHRINIIGQTFGYLTVLGYGQPKYNSQNQSIATWKCKCKCGNIIEVDTGKLTSGNTQSCGCKRKETLHNMLFKSLVGQRFDKLVVLERIFKPNNSTTFYKCQCDCGKTTIVRAADLTGLRTHSCGCIRYSIGEKNIEEILKNNNMIFQTQYSFSDLPNRRYDFAIFNTKNQIIRLIEFDGPQHFNETPYFSSTLQKRKAHDTEKNNYAIAHNIPLVRIPYTQRDKITFNMLFEDLYLINK